MEEKAGSIVPWLTTIPADDQNFKQAVKDATADDIRIALARIAGQDGEKTRETALRRRLKQLIGDELETTKGVNTRQEMGLALEMTPLIAERELQKQAAAEQIEREGRIADAFQIAGRIQAFTFIEKVVTVSSLMQLKGIKETKTYRELSGIGTWEKYCEYLGLDRHTIDERLRQLNVFGASFLETCNQFSVSHRQLRQLRQLTYDGESFHVSEDGKTVTIEGESITLSDDSAPELEAALEKLLVKNKSLRERNTKLEKDFKGAVKEEVKGYESKEKMLLKENERLKAFDPEDKDREWSVEQMEVIDTATVEYATLVGKFIIDPRMEDDRNLQARVSGLLQNAEMMLRDLRQQLDGIINLYND